MECNLCDVHLTSEHFTGHKKVCNDCQTDVAEVNKNEWICCVYCGVIMTDEQKSRSKLLSRCKACKRLHILDLKRERHHRTYKDYYNTNREKMVAKSRKWNIENKERYYQIKKTYRDRHKDEIDFRIKENLGTRLRILVRKEGHHFIDFLGCQLEFFKDWLQFNMSPDMSWENYGSYWHIDHIIPCNYYDATDTQQVRLCWNWCNLAPLQGSLNCAKIDKIDNAYIEYYKKRKVEYLQLNDNSPENI